MRRIKKNLSSIPGWTTRRRFVVFESDDWGSIRMPSPEVYSSIQRSGIDLLSDDGNRYNSYDSLATEDDLSDLFDLLSGVKDSTHRPVVITPFAVVANPDFNRIEQSDFNEYYYEPITDTLNRYPGCSNSFNMWKEGISRRLFVPQFHGREHLNVKVWMRALKNGNQKALIAFRHKVWGISTSNDPEIGVEFQAAFDFTEPSDIEYHRQVIISGLNLFEGLFGYRASCIVPPNGPFSSKLETLCFDQGIRSLSVPRIQREPIGNRKTRIRVHWLGKKGKSGLRYFTRNCFFEPGQYGIDWIDRCLYEIETAFRWNKPAIISSHRVNYIGTHARENRESGLRQLGTLLKKIVTTWPEVEFITSAELSEMIG